VGINILNLYGRELAQEFFPSLAPSFGFLINLVKTVAAALSALILTRTGRKPLLLRGVSALAFSLLMLYFGYEFHEKNPSLFGVFIIGGFFLYIFSFALSSGPLAWIYPAEIVSPSFIPFTTMAR
jgi:polyferredoxin